MNKSQYQFFARRTLKTIAIVIGSMAAAFVVGIETAGDVDPLVSATKADGTVIEGDFDNNGTVDTFDVMIALEIARGNREATPHDLSVDPNQDFHITLDDVAMMLESIDVQK